MHSEGLGIALFILGGSSVIKVFLGGSLVICRNSFLLQ
jgi:hypothetical protein